MASKNKIIIDISELEKEFKEIPSVSLTKPIANGVINGYNYQVLVIITTDEDEFIEEK